MNGVDIKHMANELANVLRHNKELLDGDITDLSAALEVRFTQAYFAGRDGKRMIESIPIRQGKTDGPVALVSPPKAFLPFKSIR
jgi:hypothetical protein